MQISIASPSEINDFTRADVTTLEGMVELCLTNNFSPSLFTNGRRKIAHFEKAYCLGMDIDNDGKLYRGQPTPLMSLEEAKEVFKDYTHLILPSRSHQKDKGGLVVDRFRVILFFTKPITDVDTFYATWQWCKDKWPAIDHQCKDPSRFYYKHSAVASTRAKGIRIEPVVPKPVDPLDIDSIDLSELPLCARGKLSRECQELLSKGLERGNRNGDTFKIAKEFQQNLYTQEEAVSRIVHALRETDTIASDFTEDEVVRTIQSAYSSDAKHDPRIKPRGLTLIPIGELYKSAGENPEMDWLVDGLLQMGGLGLLAAEPKTGKSELARQLSANVLSGTPFLGRKTQKGSVAYFGIEEDLKILVRSFQRLGVPADAPLSVHIGDPLEDSDTFEDFKEIIMETKPSLAIVDTAFDVMQVESDKDYAPIKKAFRKMRRIARQTNTHILLIHHAGKPQNGNFRSANHSVLGSIGITAGVDDIIVLQLRGNTRLISSSGRDVDPWFGREMVWNKITKTYSLGPERDEF